MAESLPLKMETGLLAHYAGMNYRYSYAIGEYIDNSIQSYLTHRAKLRKVEGRDFRLEIDLILERHPAPSMEIRDNAAGIFAADIERAFSLGMRPPDRTGLSQYGLGMKSASVWFARHFTVETCALGENIARQVTFDVDHIAETNPDNVPIRTVNAAPDEHYTRIRLNRLRRPLPGGTRAGSTLESVRSHLRNMYREFLRAGDVVIRVGGETLAYTEPPLLVSAYWPNTRGPEPDGKPVEWRKDIYFAVSGPPENPEPKLNVSGWIGILATGDTRNAGISLVWKQKIIVDGADFRPSEVFGRGNTFASQRLTGQLDVSNLTVTSFKDAVSWEGTQEEEFYAALKAQTREGERSFFSMLNHYRAEKTAASPEEIQSAISDAAERVLSNLRFVPPRENDISETVASAGEPEVAFEGEAEFPARTGPYSLAFRIVRQDRGRWLNIERDDEKWVVSINHSHPFMMHYLDLPKTSPTPIYHLGAVLASSIIDVHLTEGGGFQRRFLDVIESEVRRLHGLFEGDAQ